MSFPGYVPLKYDEYGVVIPEKEDLRNIYPKRRWILDLSDDAVITKTWLNNETWELIHMYLIAVNIVRVLNLNIAAANWGPTKMTEDKYNKIKEEQANYVADQYDRICKRFRKQEDNVSKPKYMNQLNALIGSIDEVYGEIHILKAQLDKIKGDNYYNDIEEENSDEDTNDIEEEEETNNEKQLVGNTPRGKGKSFPRLLNEYNEAVRLLLELKNTRVSGSNNRRNGISRNSCKYSPDLSAQEQKVTALARRLREKHGYKEVQDGSAYLERERDRELIDKAKEHADFFTEQDKLLDVLLLKAARRKAARAKAERAKAAKSNSGPKELDTEDEEDDDKSYKKPRRKYSGGAGCKCCVLCGGFI